MRSGLSIRGTTRRWWRKARTVAAVSPRSARGPPGSSARPEASPTTSDAGPETPHGSRSRASPGAPDRCRGETGLGVAKVEPPPLPTGVVGRHGAGNVVVLVLHPQSERHAAGAHRAAGPLLRRRLREQLRTEEVNPEIPIHRDPRYPSQTPTNVAAYEIAFGAKLCSSTP
jgi:hypothetical protein